MAFTSLSEVLKGAGGRQAVNTNPLTMYGHETKKDKGRSNFSYQLVRKMN